MTHHKNVAKNSTVWIFNNRQASYVIAISQMRKRDFCEYDNNGYLYYGSTSN